MLKMVDGTGIIGVDMVCPLGGTVSPPQPPNYDNVEMEGMGSLTLLNSLKAPLERVELIGNSVQGENPAPDNPQEIKSAGRFDEASGKYLLDVKVTGRNILSDVGDTYNVFVPCLIKAGTTVTLITNGVESDGGNILFTTDSGEDYWYAIDKGVTKVARSINKNVIGFKNLLAKKDGLKYCLVIGDTDKYEPYTEQSMQIALNEPLRGIGEYKDVLTKDGVVRRIKEVVIAADTPITCVLGQYGAPETNTVLCRYHDTSLKKTGAIICGELKNIDNWAKDEESVAMTEQGIDFRLSRERLGLGSDTTPEENKVAVIKYLENHPLHCIAELNEPITEPLPESVQQQLQALHTENGTTHVFVDSGEVPCGIKLTYRKEI